MAGRGPAPKDPEKRVRRNKETRTKLDAAATPGARSLPPGDWLPQTRAWWAAWLASPQSVLFTETAWVRLSMLAPLVERFWVDGDVNAMREIRLSESLLGATPVDLQRLRIDLDRKGQAAKPASSSRDELAERRRERRVVDHTVAGDG